MNHSFLTENAKAYLFLVMAIAVFTVLPADAQAKISDLVSNVGDEAPVMTEAVIKLFAFVGLIFIIMGIVGFMTRHKTQVPAGVCIGMLVGGILLLGIIDLSTEGLDTIFGSTSNSGLDQITGSN